MKDKKVNIDLKPLTDEEIQQGQFTLKDLWMVQLSGKNPVGPFDTYRLKNYAYKYQFLFTDAKVFNLEEDKWSDMFKVSAFQRRKPQLVSAHNLIQNQEFYVLFNGQKEGPYDQDKLQALLDKGHITTSNQVSLDEGKSWIKLYEHHAFDRRTKKSNQELPFKPTENILAKVNKKKEKLMKKSDAKDALVELAFIGESTNKIQLEKKIATPEKVHTRHNIPNVLKKSKRVTTKPVTRKSHQAWKTASVCFTLLLMIGVYVNNKQKTTSPGKPLAEVPTQAIGIDNSERTITKRVPASVNDNYEQGQQKSLNKMKRFKRIRAKRMKPVQKVLRKEKSFTKPKRVVKKEIKNEDFFEQDIENIDINDREVQDELSRQLAGEYENEDMDDRDDTDYSDRDNFEDNSYNDGYDADSQPMQDNSALDRNFEDDQVQQYDNDSYDSYQREEVQENLDY